MLILLLYFLQPQGEQWTAQEQAQAIEQVSEAVAWWEAKQGGQWQIQLGGIVEYGDPYTQWQGVGAKPDEDTIIVYVVDNSESGRHFVYQGKTYSGLSLWHVSFVLPSGGWLVAHELGHAALGLPEVSDTSDIMNSAYAQQNYAQGFIGCESLARLGQPCKHLYMPLV